MNTALTTPQTAGRPGLHYLPDFITPEEHDQLVQHLDASPWRSDLRRRVQHYGYVYDYKARVIAPEHYLGELPDFIQPIADRLMAQTGLFDETPVQAIVNEYTAGQGISWHYDALTFGPSIATVSLIEPWHMQFDRFPKRDSVSGERNSLLEVNSALIMTADSRYKWRHSIPRLRTEPDGLARGRRISLTFRTLARK